MVDKTYEEIKKHIKEYEIAPTIDELIQTTGIKSKSTVLNHLRKLEKEQKIKLVRKDDRVVARGIVLCQEKA